MKVEYITEDGSLKYTLEYITGAPMRYYGGIGKSYPRTTQCILKKNGYIIGIGEVVKHGLDEDNLQLAYKLVTKKVISKINIKWLRKKIWGVVLHKINNDGKS